jgi:hypothetical protein
VEDMCYEILVLLFGNRTQNVGPRGQDAAGRHVHGTAAPHEEPHRQCSPGRGLHQRGLAEVALGPCREITSVENLFRCRLAETDARARPKPSLWQTSIYMINIHIHD